MENKIKVGDRVAFREYIIKETTISGFSKPIGDIVRYMEHVGTVEEILTPTNNIGVSQALIAFDNGGKFYRNLSDIYLIENQEKEINEK